MDEVFLDTSWFKAIIDRNDDFHQKAHKTLTELEARQTKFITTNFVIDETFTLVRKRCGMELTKKLFEWIRNFGDNIKMIRIINKDEREAWKWFWKPWSDLSYTDCTSFAVMKRLDISQVATFDKHFEQAGFFVVS